MSDLSPMAIIITVCMGMINNKGNVRFIYIWYSMGTMVGMGRNKAKILNKIIIIIMRVMSVLHLMVGMGVMRGYAHDGGYRYE